MKKNAKIIVRTIDGKEVKILSMAFGANLKAVSNEDGKMIIEGYASVFGNIDSYYEIVDKGAFTDFIRSNFPRYPKLIWAHNWEKPIGVTLEAREDDHGLFVRGELTAGVQQAEEAYKLIKAGAITDLSFGFRVDQDYLDQATGALHLAKISIFEWSPVLVGANPEAMITSAKSILGRELSADEVKEMEEVVDNQGESVDNPPAPADPTPAEPEKPAEDPKPEGDNPTGTENEPATDPPASPSPEGNPSPDGKGLKSGRVLSAKNVELVKSALDAVDSLRSALEALLEAAENTDAASVGETPEKVGARIGKDQAGDRKVVKAFLRDAREAKGTIEKIIVRAKNF